MTAFLIAGYRMADLGIFSDKDHKLVVIKKAIRKDLISLLEEGVEWFIFQGNLGFESWCLDVAKELQDIYPLKLATIFPFADHGKNWSEANQAVLAKFRQVDYSHHSFQTYESPKQLRQHQDFLVKHTQGAYLFYDRENETQLKFLDQRLREEEDYWIKRLDFDRLNDLAQEIMEN